MRVKVTYRQIIDALERAAGNTDSDPRWLAATELRNVMLIEQRGVVIDVKVEGETCGSDWSFS